MRGVVDCYYHSTETQRSLWVEYKQDVNHNRKLKLTTAQERWLLGTQGWVIRFTGTEGHAIYKTPQQWRNLASEKIVSDYKAVAEYLTRYLNEMV